MFYFSIGIIRVDSWWCLSFKVLGYGKMKFVMVFWIRKILICVLFRLFELIDIGFCIDKGDLI